MHCMILDNPLFMHAVFYFLNNVLLLYRFEFNRGPHYSRSIHQFWTKYPQTISVQRQIISAGLGLTVPKFSWNVI